MALRAYMQPYRYAYVYTSCMHVCMRAGQVPAKPPQNAPRWVLECLLHRRWAEPRNNKISFALAPHPATPALPALGAHESRLHAPRALKLGKVVRYVEDKLGVEGDAERPAVVLYCGDSLLSEAMSLGTARTFCWKQGGPEMVLAYAEADTESRR